MDWTTDFDKRVVKVPIEWRGPAVDVHDTIKLAKLSYMEIVPECFIEDSPHFERILCIAEMMLKERHRAR